MTIAVFLPNWIGDVAMATPALRALRNHFSADRLIVVMRPHLVGLLGGTPWIDDIWPCDSRWNGGQGGRWDLVRRMRRERCDLAILLPNSFQTALLAWLGGARQRIGYVRYGRGPLLTGKLYPRRDGRRIVPAPMVVMKEWRKYQETLPLTGARFDAWTERFDPSLWRDAFERRGVDPASIRAFGDVAQALATAREDAGEADRIVVFGSFLTVAAALSAPAR